MKIISFILDIHDITTIIIKNLTMSGTYEITSYNTSLLTLEHDSLRKKIKLFY